MAVAGAVAAKGGAAMSNSVSGGMLAALGTCNQCSPGIAAAGCRQTAPQACATQIYCLLELRNLDACRGSLSRNLSCCYLPPALPTATCLLGAMPPLGGPPARATGGSASSKGTPTQAEKNANGAATGAGPKSQAQGGGGGGGGGAGSKATRDPSKLCKCKKSKCVRQYCVCFRAGMVLLCLGLGFRVSPGGRGVYIVYGNWS